MNRGLFEGWLSSAQFRGSQDCASHCLSCSGFATRYPYQPPTRTRNNEPRSIYRGRCISTLSAPNGAVTSHVMHEHLAVVLSTSARAEMCTHVRVLAQHTRVNPEQPLDDSLRTKTASVMLRSSDCRACGDLLPIRFAHGDPCYGHKWVAEYIADINIYSGCI